MPELWPDPEPYYPDVDDPYDSLQAIACFVKYYRQMKEANTIGADKYFHCMAHCCAAKKGGTVSGRWLGDIREVSDLLRNKSGNFWDQLIDSIEDLEANHHGLNCPPKKTCADQCKKYRPNGLNSKY